MCYTDNKGRICCFRALVGQKRRRMGCEGIKEKETFFVTVVSVIISDYSTGKA